MVCIDNQQDTDKTVSTSFDHAVLIADGTTGKTVLDSERDPCPCFQHH